MNVKDEANIRLFEGQDIQKDPTVIPNFEIEEWQVIDVVSICVT